LQATGCRLPVQDLSYWWPFSAQKTGKPLWKLWSLFWNSRMVIRFVPIQCSEYLGVIRQWQQEKRWKQLEHISVSLIPVPLSFGHLICEFQGRKKNLNTSCDGSLIFFSSPKSCRHATVWRWAHRKRF
jgi:hypothetical protein